MLNWPSINDGMEKGLRDYSTWIEVKRIRNKSSKEVISAWMKIFSCQGIPKEVII